jgi:Trypsin-co-occurring domain 2
MIELAEVIRQLRSELDEAFAAAQERVRFELGPIQLEVTVGVARVASGRIRFLVSEVGGEELGRSSVGKTDGASTQRLTLTLNPVADLRKPQSAEIWVRDELAEER